MTSLPQPKRIFKQSNFENVNRDDVSQLFKNDVKVKGNVEFGGKSVSFLPPIYHLKPSLVTLKTVCLGLEFIKVHG